MLGGVANEKPGQLSRSQKKAARKKLKKKEKKSAEVAFEIEEITTGFEEVSLKLSSGPAADRHESTTKRGDEEVRNYVTFTHNTKQICTQQIKTYAAISLFFFRKVSCPRDAENASPPKGTDRDRLKRERALRKKLKQIRDLEARIASGEISKPDRDQQAKIAKKADIEEELMDLAEDSS